MSTPRLGMKSHGDNDPSRIWSFSIAATARATAVLSAVVMFGLLGTGGTGAYFTASVPLGTTTIRSGTWVPSTDPVDIPPNSVESQKVPSGVAPATKAPIARAATIPDPPGRTPTVVDTADAGTTSAPGAETSIQADPAESVAEPGALTTEPSEPTAVAAADGSPEVQAPTQDAAE
jgi:hypothetical protein